MSGRLRSLALSSEPSAAAAAAAAGAGVEIVNFNNHKRKTPDKDVDDDSQMPVTIDTALVEQLDEELVCVICHQIPLHPVETKCCGHIACHECLSVCIASTNNSNGLASCPSCRSPFTTTELYESSFASRKISGLKMRCNLSSVGCTSTFLVGHQGATYRKHVLDCEFRQIVCGQCPEIVIRRELKHHRETVCPERSITCGLCLVSMKKDAYEAHVRAAAHPLLGCENRMFCPFGCRMPSVPVIPPVCPAAAAAGAVESELVPGADHEPNDSVGCARSFEGEAVSKRPRTTDAPSPALAPSVLDTASASPTPTANRETLAPSAAAAGAAHRAPIPPASHVIALVQDTPSPAPAFMLTTASQPSAPLTFPARPHSAGAPTAAAASASSSVGAAAESTATPPPTDRTILLCSELPQHTAVCVCYRVACAFCNVKMPRGELGEHMKAKDIHHLVLLKSELNQALKKIDDLKREVNVPRQPRQFVEHRMQIPHNYQSQKIEATSVESQSPSGHTFAVYGVIENDKIGVFLKYRSGPLPVTVEFTVAVQEPFYHVGSSLLPRLRCYNDAQFVSDDINPPTFGFAPPAAAAGDGAAASADPAAATAALGSHSRPRVRTRSLGKRSTRWTISEKTHSIVGFSQVATMSEYLDHIFAAKMTCTDDIEAEEPEPFPVDLMVGMVYRVLPNAIPDWLQSSRYL